MFLDLLSNKKNATDGSRYKFSPVRNTNNNAINGAGAIAEARTFRRSNVWFVQFYTPKISQLKILSKDTVFKVPSELHCIERSV